MDSILTYVMLAIAGVIGFIVLLRVLGMVRAAAWKQATPTVRQDRTLRTPDRTPEPVAMTRCKPKTLAERYEDWGTDALGLEDAQEQAFMNLVQLDREQGRREALMAAARKRSKENALKGAYLDNRAGNTLPNV